MGVIESTKGIMGARVVNCSENETSTLFRRMPLERVCWGRGVCVCVWGGGDLRECGVNFPGRNRSLIRPPFYHLLFIFWWKEPQQHLAARSLCLSLHASLSAPCCCQAVCLFVCLLACMPFCLAAYAPAVSVTLSTACLPGTHFIILPFLVFSHVDFISP